MSDIAIENDHRYHQIKQIIGNYIERDPNVIKPEMTLEKHLGLDSLDSVEMIIDVENSFNIAITDPVADDIKTVSDLYEAVRSLT